VVATVAHELRNLLQPIELYATLLGEQCATTPELGPLSGRLLLGVKQLRAVASNLLSVVRRPQIEWGPVDLGQVALESVESARLAIRGTGIVLRPRLRLAKAEVLGDAGEIRRAILNLVLNAVQAMPEGGSLTIALRARDDCAELAIRDTGIGMDRATLGRATEPFFTTRPHGTGLGLAVVREVAATHGARFRIQSRPGSGTAVRLAFPLCHPAERETPAEALAGALA
jgi:signal transduction histidine kinase